MSKHFLLAFAACLATTGCAPEGGRVTPLADISDEASQIAATIGDRNITFDELDAYAKDEMFARETSDGDPAQLYELRAAAVERMIDKSLVEAAAETQQMTADDYLRHVVETENDVTDAEVQTYYDENQERMSGASFEQMSDRIRGFLRSQRASEVIAKLRGESGARVLLEPPRIEVVASGPAKGPAGAPVTIVEFSDFQCPYCQRVVPTLEQIVAAYPDQVRVVFRHLPLDGIHGRARPAAEASACADKQGQFWAYHDLIFENNRALADADLEKYATDIGLDVEAFRKCVADREFQALVEGDAKAAEELGLTGTPAFFVNGIQVRGAKPFEEFVTIIDRELARAAAGATPSS